MYENKTIIKNVTLKFFSLTKNVRYSFVWTVNEDHLVQLYISRTEPLNDWIYTNYNRQEGNLLTGSVTVTTNKFELTDLQCHESFPGSTYITTFFYQWYIVLSRVGEWSVWLSPSSLTV